MELSEARWPLSAKYGAVLMGEARASYCHVDLLSITALPH